MMPKGHAFHMVPRREAVCIYCGEPFLAVREGHDGCYRRLCWARRDAERQRRSRARRRANAA